jgi:hypothetical protein
MEDIIMAVLIGRVGKSKPKKSIHRTTVANRRVEKKMREEDITFDEAIVDVLETQAKLVDYISTSGRDGTLNNYISENCSIKDKANLKIRKWLGQDHTKLVNKALGIIEKNVDKAGQKYINHERQKLANQPLSDRDIDIFKFLIPIFVPMLAMMFQENQQTARKIVKNTHEAPSTFLSTSVGNNSQGGGFLGGGIMPLLLGGGLGGGFGGCGNNFVADFSGSGAGSAPNMLY